MRFLVGPLFVIGFLLAGLAMPVQNYLLANRPTEPDISQGWTHPYSARGKTVYATRVEESVASWIFVCGAVTVLAASIAFKRAYPDWPGHNRNT